MASPSGKHVSSERVDFSEERERHRGLVARQEVLEEIHGLFEGGASAILVTGAPGIGKSAILANYLDHVDAAAAEGSSTESLRAKIAGSSRHLARWTEQLVRTLDPKERWWAASHFMRHGDLARPEVVARSLAAEIEDRFIDERDRGAAPERRLIELLDRVSKDVLQDEGLRLLLVIDGLDEAEGDDLDLLARLLPEELPPRVHLLCSSRPVSTHLGWIERYVPAHVDLDAPRWSASNEAVSRAFWDRVGKELELQPDLVGAIVRRAQGNMLYSVELAAWMRKQPREEWRIDRIPETLRDVLDRLWSQIARLSSRQEELVQRGLAVLCEAGAPVSLAAVAAQAGWGTQLSVDDFLRVTRPFLQLAPEEGADAFRPFHEALREFVAEKLGGEAPPAPAAARGAAEDYAAMMAAREDAHDVISARHALVVGVSRYDDENIGDLRYCANDAERLAATLGARGFDTVIALHDEVGDDRLLPTHHHVKNELVRLAKSLAPNDMLLVHFSCHGRHLDDGRPVLLLRDTGNQTLAESTLSLDEVRAILAESPARRKLLLLDACHAGVAMGRDGEEKGLDPGFVRDVFELAEGLAVISASTAEQRAMEREDRELGVFTSFVIEALEGKADRSSPKKGFVTVDDLVHHVTAGVKQWTRAARLDLQIPTARLEGVGSFIVVDLRKKRG